jgi:hypothetical protein
MIQLFSNKSLHHIPPLYTGSYLETANKILIIYLLAREDKVCAMAMCSMSALHFTIHADPNELLPQPKHTPSYSQRNSIMKHINHTCINITSIQS